MSGPAPQVSPAQQLPAPASLEQPKPYKPSNTSDEQAQDVTDGIHANMAPLASNDANSTPKSSSPQKSTFSRLSIDEEKSTRNQDSSLHKARVKKRQHILEITQRSTSLALSVIILGIMSHAYLTFLAHKDVTAGGQAIYPTFMNLWPTYLIITAAAVTVVINSCIVFWHIHGTVKDLAREEIINKYWEYASHGINFLIWLGTTTTFRISKNWGPAQDPNVLWGYTCSSTAQMLNETYPQIIKFYVQCELQTVSWWMGASAVLVEVFAVAAKIILR